MPAKPKKKKVLSPE
jgi:hypothetical protein